MVFTHFALIFVSKSREKNCGKSFPKLGDKNIVPKYHCMYNNIIPTHVLCVCVCVCVFCFCLFVCLFVFCKLKPLLLCSTPLFVCDISLHMFVSPQGAAAQIEGGYVVISRKNMNVTSSKTIFKTFLEMCFHIFDLYGVIPSEKTN